VKESKATKQPTLSFCPIDFFAEPVIGRAFARPVGSQRRTGGASRREVANVYLDFTLYLFISSMRADGDASAAP
jgi:hypothetical protein